MGFLSPQRGLLGFEKVWAFKELVQLLAKVGGVNSAYPPTSVGWSNFKMARPSTASQGGLLDHNDQVVFPIGTTFSTTNWDALVEYLVSQRVHWSKTAVANVLRMARADSSFRKSFDEVFVQDILGFGTSLSWDPPDSADAFSTKLVSRTNGSPLPYGTLLIERVVVWAGIQGTSAPPALEATRDTGGEMELSLFRNNFFYGSHSGPYLDGTFPPALTDYEDFSFVDIRIEYRLVYYLPSISVGSNDHWLELGMENYTSQLTDRLWGTHPTNLNPEAGSDPMMGYAGLAREILRNETATLFEYEDGAPADGDIQYATTATGQELIRVKIADFDSPLTRTQLHPQNMWTLKDQIVNPAYTEDAIQTTNSRLARKVEVQKIASDPMYKKIFSETFNQEFITMVPVYENFYLTSRYFGKIETVFDSTKNFIIQAFIDVVTGKDPRPPVGNERPNAAAAVRNSAGPDFAARFEGLGRDFILKMLIETPIMILKGLAEMIDPHVAIWKVVRNVTGMAFSELAKVMDASGALQAVDDALAEANAPPIGMRGDDLIALMLCLLDFGMTSAIMADPKTQNVPEEVINNILPRMSTEGIDFTGTFSGMLMLPPLPFGILYILLDLLKKHLAEELTSDDSALSGEESLAEC